MIMWPGQITLKPLGLKYTWQNESCSWVSVPKNANMMFRKLCTAIGMHKQIRYNLSPESFAVVRDPRTRLFSGICEYLRRLHQPITEAKIIDNLIDLRYNPSKFDEHLEPQIVWLNELSFTHLVRFEYMIEDTMRIPYLRQHEKMVLKSIKPNRLTTSRYYIDMNGFIAKHQALIDSTIDKHYKQDLELFNNIRNYENKLITLS